MYRRSPVHHLQAAGLDAGRWRLEAGEGRDAFPVLAELRAEGGTDYLMRLVRFGGPTAAALPGVALAFATDRPGGFADPEVAALDALLPALGLASYRFALARTASDVLGVYLGPMTARRVLAGEVRRGTGRAITAAILLADLRGFTALAGREDPRRVGGLARRAPGGGGRPGRGARGRGAQVPGRRAARRCSRPTGRAGPRRTPAPARSRRRGGARAHGGR
jgi:adenylate cyclase